MTNFCVTYTFKDKESRDGFYGAIRENGIRALCYEEDGCVRYDYFYPAEEDNKLFLWEAWETREHQSAHCKTPHFAMLSKFKEQFGAETDIVIQDVK